jgi:hypothetical protein
VQACWRAHGRLMPSGRPWPRRRDPGIRPVDFGCRRLAGARCSVRGTLALKDLREGLGEALLVRRFHSSRVLSISGFARVGESGWLWSSRLIALAMSLVWRSAIGWCCSA